MNRKLIVNENLGWPDINEADSKKIVEFFESFLKANQSLRRKKTLPKKLRLKKEAENAVNDKKSDDFGKYFKKYIKIGINSITKTLETNPNSLAIVLICRSCKPLTVLTRHIQVMCSISNVSAGCVHNLNNLSKILNIKTVTAFGICKNNELESNSIYKKTHDDFLNELDQKVVNLLPQLKNPFTSNDYLNPTFLCIEDVNNELNKVDLNEEIDRMPKFSNREWSNAQENFGSDFISIDKSLKKSFTNFDDDNFILFDDRDQRNFNIDIESMDEGG
ncbi:unnamed protein product [Brachionus calyciflorus]|uniref:Ribosomal protein L7Ae/L30e/S12e/Gadd45 domain-containing protein n=1 Tax=Brachionus calyciflorus TaxID=104777 RepID=A0A813S4B7_9BILA|nr:unnamed protein product [Brachionus calyciflorus]